ncbi:hypothetical protein [Streptomyces sp. NPDC005077]|uniref:hypothetical protein n=1 Tax=Streptomyces sp. NPDC005077 TaxID=3154292 RepID=UPI0033A16BB4
MRRRVLGRVHRAGDNTAHVAVPAWMSGQILVPVLTYTLAKALDAKAADLTGRWLTVCIDPSARGEDDLYAHDWATADHPRHATFKELEYR